ncbi:MAG: hypothetical protein HOQ22_00700 [Nocardioidaceae bacterium]|nr:hypothetical protein [Nocardioidaceae bacterium]NUS49547.1 hypothetical protein [Nocardioidaceae bacterium]
MTPHPLATWVQSSVSPQRHAVRRRRRLAAARLVLMASLPQSGETAEPGVTTRRSL